MATISYKEAAHLLRRMGFGGSAAEIDDLVARGREGAVDYLINYSQIDNSAMEDLLQRSFDFSDPFDFPRFNIAELQRWWLTRMVFTRRQFEEKMTLFWHDHFATAVSKVPELFMYIQNLTLRNNALTRFDDLLLRVAQDPAMLIWLDGITSVRGRPNENFARELQELFSMGITDTVTGEANYTEQDVKEIARAFTGWQVAPVRDRPFEWNFFVNQALHDNTAKTVYGQTANFTGQDIITIVSARRATARYLAKKLIDYFVYPLDSSPEDLATIEKFADVYMNRNHSILELLRAIFTSDEFFSPRAQFALVKSPVELIVGAIRVLGATYNPGSVDRGQNPNLLGFFTTFLGQQLFNPPDVAGWTMNLGWVNTATLLNRFTFADFVAINRPGDPNAPGLYLSHAQLKSQAKKKAKKTVKKLLNQMGPLTVDAETMNALISYLETDDQGNFVKFSRDDLTVDKKMRGLIHLVMCMTEFQLN
ncbi:MAG: DUF1800 domain-containing protein [Blastocatellia bacterium]|nr:DUF1800 domain-containing protein [Blastocatellia bacterium]